VAPAATPGGEARESDERRHRPAPVRSSDLTERMKQQGMEPVGSTPAEFDAIDQERDRTKWAKVVKLSGAKVD